MTLFSRFSVVVVAVLLAMGAQTGSVGADLTTRLNQFAEAQRVKVVFTRCAEKDTDDFPTNGYQKSEVLVGIDSRDGKEDTLQTALGNYENPLITRSGSRIVFTDFQSGKSKIVDWTKNAPARTIVNGATCCLWYDQTKNKEYSIYLFDNKFRKINLDDSTDDVLLYTPSSSTIASISWIRVSSDLRAIGGCMGGYSPTNAPIEVHDIKTGEKLITFPGMCWTTMPYDTTCRLVKSLNHGGWQGKTLTDDFGEFTVFTGGEDISHSQMRMATYSSTIFLFVTEAAGGDNGTGNIFAARANPELTKWLDTIKITSRIGKDHHADMWIEPPVQVQSLDKGAPAPCHERSIITPDHGSRARILSLNGRVLATVPANAVSGTIAALPAKPYIIEYMVNNRPVTAIRNQLHKNR